MKRLILIFSLVFLTACSNEIYSISGEINSIEEDSFSMDCSELVAKSNKSQIQEDIGYSCVIKITDATIINAKAADELTSNELNTANFVIVYLEESKTLSADLESRTLEAKEITILESK